MPSGDQDTPGHRRTAGGISLQTLLVASAASAVTSYVVSRVWGPGTIIGAAATPVLVALIAESLRKPVETVSATARRVPVVVQPVVAGRPRPRAGAAADPGDDASPPVDPGYVATLEADELVRTSVRSGPRWGLVLATAAAAFAIVVAIYTIPDLVAGKSITGNGRATTLFGGRRSSGSKVKQHTSTGGQGTTSTSTGATTSTQTTTTTKTVTTTAPAPATTTTAPPATTTTTTPTTAPGTTTPVPTTPLTPTNGTAPPGSTTTATP